MSPELKGHEARAAKALAETMESWPEESADLFADEHDEAAVRYFSDLLLRLFKRTAS